MRKRSFIKLIKRTILAVILLIIVTVGLVFMLDTYAPTKNNYTNKYNDEYWKQETLEGFEYFKDTEKRVNKFDVGNKSEYQLPWVRDGIKESTLGDLDKLQAATYLEELNYIDSKYKFTQTYNTKKSALDLLGPLNMEVKVWVEKFLELEEEDYKDVTTTATSVYEFAKALGYSDSKTDFLSTLKQAVSIPKLRKALNDAGFYYDDDEKTLLEFAYLLVTDLEVDTYFNTIADKEAYNEALKELELYQPLMDYYNEASKSLLAWKDYYKDALLGFGGLATDYPNKPVLEAKGENGTTYQFWFNSYLTTFKLVQVDSDNNILQEWYSNPQEEDKKANPSVKILENSILQMSYSILKGKTDSYSTYQYSVSDKQGTETVTPQFAVKMDSENNTVTVWYKLSKRGIDYTYFPYYFSTERLQELLARNQALFDAQAVDSSGKRIPDLDGKDANGNDYLRDSKGNVLDAEGNIIGDKNCIALTDYALFTVTYYSKSNVGDIDNAFDREYYHYGSSNGETTTSNKMENMSGNVIKDLYKYLYEWCGYTEKDLLEDNMEFGVTNNNNNPVYSIAIEYSLTSKGLEVTIPGNSIVEDPGYPLTYIDILPYFTATVAGTEGYTVVPDGSGAIINHDNGNTNYSKFQKRIYSTDLTNTSFVNKGKTNDVMFPMYSVINTGIASGLVAYAKSNAAQLQLTADVSGREDSYNKNYFSAYLRESQNVIIGSSYYKQELTKWTAAKVTNDIVLDFELLDNTNLSYSGAANHYRNILIDLYGLTDKDNTTLPTLNLDVLGTYSYTDNFLGVNYTAKDSLTTIEELKEIIDAMKKIGIENMNIFYKGWRKETLKNYSFKNMKVSSLIGSKAKFQALLNEANENVSIYPYVSFGEVNKYLESFGYNHYTARGVDGNYITRYPYDLNSNTYNKKLDKISIVSPRYYEAFATSLANNYSRLTKGADTLAVDLLGSGLSGDYKKGIETFKVDAVKNQIASLDILSNKGINDLTLYAPYDYALKYVTVAKDIPYQTTQYEIFDYSVPFYQLVVNGLFDYSGDSINANSEKGLVEHIMRMLETGSNISFTFTYDSSEKLLQTNYNNYYYTQYLDWVNDVKTVYDTLLDTGIYNARLINHELITNNVYKVTYKTNDTNNHIDIYLNYTRNSVVAEGLTVPAKSYLVIK